MAGSLLLPKWYDLHTHFRQGANVPAYIADHLSMGCAGALAMPNTKPPVSQVSGPKTDSAWSIEAYRADLNQAGADKFDQLITPLYLTADTTASMIEAGAASGLLRAAKYYPPHGTTNAEYGIPMDDWIGSDVFKAMEANEVVLCIHGEQHALNGSEYFDAEQTAESDFYAHRLPKILDEHPNLRIVCEHITTAKAAEFVSEAPSHVGATITPQHLLYTVGHLIQGLKYHLYCLPVVKFERDRAALRDAVLAPGQFKFFAGTDSAPHVDAAKQSGCGCAGIYTAPNTMSCLAALFEGEGALDKLEGFVSRHGPAFYRLPVNAQTITLIKRDTPIEFPDKCETPDGAVTIFDCGQPLFWEVEMS